MTVRRPRAAVAILLAGLLALPACKKKDGGSAPTDLGLRSDPNMRMRSQNNMKIIGLGIHSFNDANTHMPAGVYGPDGKIGLSWRVQILPYIEEDNLYRQFRLNEPWDSPHNKALIPQMPKIYGPPDKEIDTNGHTYLRMFAGPGALVPLNPPKGQPGQAVRGLRLFNDMPDGMSNTAMVVEAGEAVIWTKPDELEYKPDGAPPKLGGVFRDGVNVLLCDGSVRYFKSPIPPAKLKALITYNGGEAIDFDD